LPAHQAGDLLFAVVSADTGTTQAWSGFSGLKGAASQDSPSAPVNDTLDANNSTASDMELVPASPGVGDGYYFGFGATFNQVRVNVGTNGVATWTITWKYWNGSTWANLSGVTDGSNGWTAGTGNRDITFTIPGDWATTTVAGTTAYWVKAEITAFTSMSTRPLGTQAWVRHSSFPWTQLFSGSNTVNLGVVYKIAQSADESPQATFFYTIAETANAAVLSIRDVDTATPIANSAQANAAAARVAMPTTTATRNNSLIIYAAAHASTAVIPSIIEGPVTQITAKDGSAHSDAIAWGFKATSGTTPNNVTYSVAGTTFTARLATIVINPPSGGATVIPTYCAADSSTFIDPINGVTAYNGNTAWAGTALTYFTSPLAGRTLANATASAQTDRGINTYRSTGGMTGPATATSTWQGATLVLAAANRPNVTGKNVLLHGMPLLPADLQTVDGVNLGLGIAVGMFSSADNARVWHVHGAGTPWGINRVPVVINSGNTTGLIDTRGTFDATSVLGFACFTSGFLVSSDWHWAMIWMLDTTVIAGGTASEPIDVTNIRIAAADGHERMSVIQQAANQLLVLQPLQFGDGGTNPTYLDLNNTAIEFPRQYNKASGQVYYCSVDNVAGIKYNPGASDTIKHRNSIISSPSRYHWGLHASASTSATYDFSGLAVIGAGTITLNKAITITELTINDYSTVDASNLTLNDSAITNVPTASNSITVNGTSAFNRCNINVTGVTAGNYWVSTATPNQFTDCEFTGSASTGHAIRITATGTFNLVGNTFTGFGADGTTSAAIFNDSGGAVTLNISGGGNVPTVRNGTGASTTVNNVVTVKLTAKDANTLAAIGNARVLMEADSVATGTHTGANNASILTDSSKTFTTNELVGYRIYNTTDGSNGSITANTATTVTATLAGGTENDWDTGDAYIIVALPALNPVSITSSGTTATVTHKNHGLKTGASVVIRGATQDVYNGMFTITVSDANTYTYTLPSSFTGSASGSPTSTAVILSGTTDSQTGILQTTSFNFVINQPVTGKVRRATTGTLYKTGAITGTITSAGLDTTVLLIPDA
jgi:hypothetical protein